MISSPAVNFSASTKNFSPSTKAETLALLTALIVSLPSCVVTIYLDSNVTISNYKKLILGNNILTFRHKFKSDHIWIWSTIKYIITHLNLMVRLIKVKGHSNDIHNNKADVLAKIRIIKDELSINVPTSN